MGLNMLKICRYNYIYKMSASKDVTKTVSGFYGKMDKITKMKPGTLKYKRFVQGLECLEAHITVELDEDNMLPEDFVDQLEALIVESVSCEDHVEFVADEEKFATLVTFFKYL